MGLQGVHEVLLGRRHRVLRLEIHVSQLHNGKCGVADEHADAAAAAAAKKKKVVRLREEAERAREESPPVHSE